MFLENTGNGKGSSEEKQLRTGAEERGRACEQGWGDRGSP